jgi:hypothetical protein
MTTQESARTSAATTQDQQRDRAARGIGSRPTSPSGGRPAPPRRRRPALAALAVLLIVGGAALAGLLALRLDSRDPVLMLNQDVPAGTAITAEMLSTTPVASEGLKLVPESQVDEVLGTFTSTALSEGQLLDTTVLTTKEPFGSQSAQVGVALASGQVPSGLRSGDEVRLVRVGDGNSPVRPLATGLVLSTDAPSEGGIAGGPAAGTATVLVPVGAADEVVDAAGSDVLGMSLLRRGVPIDKANLDVLGGRS